MKKHRFPQAGKAVVRRLRTGGVVVLGGAAVIAALVQWEGQKTTVYPDRLAGGLPTVCSGRTSWQLVPGTKFEKWECDAIDRATAIEYGGAVLNCVRHDVLDQPMLDALTLFAINVGKAGMCRSRAVRLINAGQVRAGCAALAHSPSGRPAWSYAGGRYIQGLHNRRLYERNWCLQSAFAGGGK